MSLDLTPARRRWLSLGLAALAYFVAYPGDLNALLTPIETVLQLSSRLATGAYVLLGLLVVAWVLVKIWGQRPAPAPEGRSFDA